jgi:hypothetical protein
MGQMSGGALGGSKRRPDWPRRLIEVVQGWRSVPFVWGHSDCLGLCIACERAMLGASRFEGLPPYDSEAGAARGLVGLGFGSVAQLVASRLPEQPVAVAQRGDWVMRQAIGALPGAFGVVLGEVSAHMSLAGLILLPTMGAARSWRI